MPHKFNAARRHKFDKAQYRSVVARIGAGMEFPFFQAAVSGDVFEHRLSERGH